jgi:hypothetical protein
MSQATDYAGVEEAAGFQPSGVSHSSWVGTAVKRETSQPTTMGFPCWAREDSFHSVFSPSSEFVMILALPLVYEKRRKAVATVTRTETPVPIKTSRIVLGSD